MAKQKTAQRSKYLEKILSVASIMIFCLSWSLGGLRTDNTDSHFFEQSLSNDEKVVEVTPNLFKIISSTQTDTDNASPKKWISFGSGIGYGGDLRVGTVFLPEGKIHSVSLLLSKETSSYFEKIVEEKLPQTLLDQGIEKIIQIDAISGATLTSQAYVQAINQSVDPVRQKLFGYLISKKPAPWEYLTWLDLAALVFFMVAVWVNRTRSAHKVKINTCLLLGSTLVFGFHSASLYGASTMGAFIFGSWITGVASYTPFILLGLSLVYILCYNRNIYCESLCPFGAAQKCLGKIGNAKPSPIRHGFFIWLPRILLLLTLCMGAYFRNPASFVYEPFGIAFGMIGGMYLFVLTVLILLTSLIVRRPWCQSLCPINAMTDFVVFNKTWFKQILRTKKQEKDKHKEGRI